MKKRLMMTLGLVGSGVVLAAGPAFAASTPETLEFVKLLTDYCVANKALPQAVRTLARQKKLEPIPLEGAIQSLMVDDSTGQVWKVPSASGRTFALSIQDDPQTCTIWTAAVDVAEIQAVFKAFPKDLQSRGLESKINTDEPLQTQSGVGRLIMLTSKSESYGNYLYTLAVGDKPASLVPGTQFQAALELRTIKRAPPGAAPKPKTPEKN